MNDILPPGTIFPHHTSYWKIIDVPRNRLGGFGHPSRHTMDNVYPVIKCSKNGKEFQQRNGFAISFVHAIPKDQLGFAPVGEKASTDGVENGVKKRRIQFLEARIADDVAELKRLCSELNTTPSLDCLRELDSSK